MNGNESYGGSTAVIDPVHGIPCSYCSCCIRLCMKVCAILDAAN